MSDYEPKTFTKEQAIAFLKRNSQIGFERVYDEETHIEVVSLQCLNGNVSTRVDTFNPMGNGTYDAVAISVFCGY